MKNNIRNPREHIYIHHQEPISDQARDAEDAAGQLFAVVSPRGPIDNFYRALAIETDKLTLSPYYIARVIYSASDNRAPSLSRRRRRRKLAAMRRCLSF